MIASSAKSQTNAIGDAIAPHPPDFSGSVASEAVVTSGAGVTAGSVASGVSMEVVASASVVVSAVSVCV